MFPLVYSFGPHQRFDFEELMNDYGCRIFIFNPYISIEPGDESLIFGQFGIAAVDSDPTSQIKFKTLQSTYDMYKSNHSGKHIDYLKFETKGSSWDVLSQIVDSGMLKHVRQLSIQIHFKETESIQEQRNKIKILKSIEDYGMVRFSSRPSYSSATYFPNLGVKGYLLYDLTWYNPLNCFNF